MSLDGLPLPRSPGPLALGSRLCRPFLPASGFSGGSRPLVAASAHGAPTDTPVPDGAGRGPAPPEAVPRGWHLTPTGHFLCPMANPWQVVTLSPRPSGPRYRRNPRPVHRSREVERQPRAGWMPGATRIRLGTWGWGAQTRRSGPRQSQGTTVTPAPADTS